MDTIALIILVGETSKACAFLEKIAPKIDAIRGGEGVIKMGLLSTILEECREE